MKRQHHANLSWFNFDLSSADETFTISKASLIQESIFALSQEKASLHRPRSKVVMFHFKTNLTLVVRVHQRCLPYLVLHQHLVAGIPE